MSCPICGEVVLKNGSHQTGDHIFNCEGEPLIRWYVKFLLLANEPYDMIGFKDNIYYLCKDNIAYNKVELNITSLDPKGAQSILVKYNKLKAFS